ncbi:MAG: aspartate kinase [Spirochaeta sp.]|jgi:aspartate kinase|nr:aspartate kinase [Spirochaeta sp.]
MSTVVSKFGGSSVANAEQIRKVAAIVRDDPRRRVVVVSAPGKRSKEDEKITDILISCHARAAAGKDFRPRFALIRERYASIAADLGLGNDLEPVLDEVEASIAGGADDSAVVSRGEYLGAHLIARFLGAEFVDAAELIRFANSTAIDDAATDHAVRERLGGNGVVVIPGFYGAHADGRVQLFSRGGSDISASLIARALGAERYENWTDVSGLLSADPRVVTDPDPIAEVTYHELRELAYLGANVFHDEAVAPVADANIPIQIRNTNEPGHPGTMITSGASAEPRPAGTRTGVAGKTGFAGVLVKRSMLSKISDLPGQLGSVLGGAGIRLHHCALGSDSALAIVESAALDAAGVGVLKEIETLFSAHSVERTGPYALVGAVGTDLAVVPEVLGTVLTAFAAAKLPIHFVSSGYSRSSFIVAVDEDRYQEAIWQVYAATA